MTALWKKTALGNLGRIVTGKTPSSEKPEDFGDVYPFITPSDISGTQKRTVTARFLSEQGATGLKGSLLPDKAICVVCIGATIGKVTLTDRPSFSNQQINSVIPYKGQHDPNFVFYLCRLLPATLFSFAGGAATPIINKSTFSSIEVPVPEYKEQRKIAAILTAYDDLIANNQRRIALLESMAEEIYREWFVRGRFPGAQRTRASEMLPFEHLCMLSRGFDLPDSDMQPGDVPVIASTSIKGYHNVAKVRPPVVTTGRSGSLGTVLFVNQPAWPLNTALYVKDFKGNSPYLVFFTLKNLHLENFNAGAGVPTLNRNHLAGIRVHVPPRQTQQRFDEQVGPILQLSEQLRRANEALTAQRDALLPRLISGKLRVDHLDIQLPPSMRAEQAERAHHPT